jgi:hypothetical protein
MKGQRMKSVKVLAVAVCLVGSVAHSVHGDPVACCQYAVFEDPGEPLYIYLAEFYQPNPCEGYGDPVYHMESTAATNLPQICTDIPCPCQVARFAAVKDDTESRDNDAPERGINPANRRLPRRLPASYDLVRPGFIKLSQEMLYVEIHETDGGNHRRIKVLVFTGYIDASIAIGDESIQDKMKKKAHPVLLGFELKDDVEMPEGARTIPFNKVEKAKHQESVYSAEIDISNIPGSGKPRRHFILANTQIHKK